MNKSNNIHNNVFEYSIIVAIYNVAEYIEEMANSIINQTIGFEDHIQLILVNDGSTDNSEEVCLKLKEQYPHNIVYLYQENSGVSAARNNGIKYATGKYLNFLDGDDYLALDAIEKVDDFFNQHEGELDLVAIRLKIFGKNQIHPLDYKFDSTRVVDILEDFKDIQLSSSSAFIKKTALENRQFDENMKYAEDAKLITHIILDKKKYGIVHDAIYHYRKRAEGNSATQSCSSDKTWYSDIIDDFYQDIIDCSLKKLGEVPKYIQYIIMYDLQWKLNVPDVSGVLTEEEIEEFYQKVHNILQYVEVSMLYTPQNTSIFRKNYFQLIKEKKPYNQIFILDIIDGEVVLRKQTNYVVARLKHQKPFIEMIYEDSGNLVIEGHMGSLFDLSQYELRAKLNKKYIKLEEIDRTMHNIYSLNRLVKAYKGFRITLPIENLKDISSIKFYAYSMEKLIPLKLKFGKYGRFDLNSGQNYAPLKNIIVEYKKNKLFILKKKKRRVLKRELITLKKGIKAREFTFKSAALRLLWLFLYLTKTKNIWLFMDRQDKADDNAEHLFKYTISKNEKEIKPIFIIKKDSPDYKRIKKIGTVIPYRSFRHKIYLLLSDKIISSHCDEWVINPFFERRKFYTNLFNYDFIFLQHGIIKEDLSNWLNKYRKNLRRIVCSSEIEEDGLRTFNYNYDSTEIILTGLPRYDNLTINPAKKPKQLLIMPSWRNHLVKPKDQVLGVRPYNADFKNSQYFKYYNAIINDKKLIKVAKKLGYKIMFVPHPDMIVQLNDFDRNDYVEFTDYKTSYQTYFNESSLLLTDYSSVFFDFAYMKKPVVYFHYDREEYHFKQGNFDYEKMGFGEIIDSKKELIRTLINYMYNDCTMKDIYVERVDKFFAYTDANNCNRVYDQILAINEKIAN